MSPLEYAPFPHTLQKVCDFNDSYITTPRDVSGSLIETGGQGLYFLDENGSRKWVVRAKFGFDVEAYKQAQEHWKILENFGLSIPTNHIIVGHRSSLSKPHTYLVVKYVAGKPLPSSLTYMSQEESVRKVLYFYNALFHYYYFVTTKKSSHLWDIMPRQCICEPNDNVSLVDLDARFYPNSISKLQKTLAIPIINYSQILERIEEPRRRFPVLASETRGILGELSELKTISWANNYREIIKEIMTGLK